ncbi:hypothetical protein ASG11_17860 [Sphingomonas sp. Leaf357]|uniref:hypothetical protein n=1 Tax=Sphingomonas sp. Leaf357 TaxID=1736350 RepID=UPI0006FEDD11|nr:hypothetical protein [Sphingomonas sp. Leaf357]KQS01520.1 hypothetical protein ASG11_17860 [Sphingomonas sp. Leaf357]
MGFSSYDTSPKTVAFPSHGMIEINPRANYWGEGYFFHYNNFKKGNAKLLPADFEREKKGSSQFLYVASGANRVADFVAKYQELQKIGFDFCIGYESSLFEVIGQFETKVDNLKQMFFESDQPIDDWMALRGIPNIRDIASELAKSTELTAYSVETIRCASGKNRLRRISSVS